MNIMDLNFFVLLQRAIELLAFYLILANISGMELKESFFRLFRNKQKIFYANWILMVVYPVGIAWLCELWSYPHAHFIDQLLRPFVAYFLLRLTFNLKRALLTYIMSLGVAIIIGIIAFIFALYSNHLHGVLFFLLTLSTITFMADRNDFRKIYTRLFRKKWVLNAICTLSFVSYLFYMFSGIFPFEFSTIISLCLFVAAAIRLKRETRLIIEQIKNTTSGELLLNLKDLSERVVENEVAHQYIIKNQNHLVIGPPLAKKLEFHKRMGTFTDYECIITKKQIKINVIL